MATDKTKQPADDMTFEASLTRLEEIVGQLEKGDLALEDALKVFEEGVRLSKSCMKILEEAERKVEVLLEDKDGAKRLQPFEREGEETEPESYGTSDRPEGLPR